MDDIDFIPLKNLPLSGLTAYTFSPPRENGTAEPDNVLTAGFGRFTEVSMVGRTIDGKMWFASSLASPKEIKLDLKAFKKLLKENEK